MKLSLDLRTSLSQTLTPQQIQYLKLLQLPLVQLEQQVRQEIEINPMLDEFDGSMDYATGESDYQQEGAPPDTFEHKQDDFGTYDSQSDDSHYENEPKSQIDDQADPFEFYKLVWQDDSDYPAKGKGQYEDDDFEPFQIKDTITFIEELAQQLRMLNLTEEEYILSDLILGNIDNDGYLRRELVEIIEDTNIEIAERNLRLKEIEIKETEENIITENKNPALQFAISADAKNIVDVYKGTAKPLVKKTAPISRDLIPVDMEIAERILTYIQHLDPPGIGSRSVRECLLSQCRMLPKKNAAQKLAQEILENAYEAFAMKHYHIIKKQFEVTDDYLKEAIELIRKLNPKPGGADFHHEMNTVVPDFMVEKDEDTNELMITVNDSRIPALKVNDTYEKIRKEAKYKMFNKDTREWIRNKYEDAKFLIQAIRQRKSTMLKVMTSIAFLQKDFFDYGANALKPLIYKDVSEKTGLDISTICRIVNGKYVQTEFGTFELKFFFSESLPNEDGEEVSTRVIKQIIKDIIEAETKDKPFSDDKISEELKEKGYLVARRTVAKYREQLKIPVARLRKEL